jgi:hypothetical protein
MGGDKLFNGRDFSQLQAMNRDAFGAKTAFELSCRYRWRRVRDSSEESRPRREARDLPEVFGIVGCDPDGTSRSQRSMKYSKKIFRHKTARCMSPFRPRIWKEDMKHRNGFRGQQALDGV